MDETTFLVSLLADNWNAAITALGSDIPAVHRVRPQIMDIRSMDSTRNTTNPGRGGNRARISRAKDQRNQRINCSEVDIDARSAAADPGGSDLEW